MPTNQKVLDLLQDRLAAELGAVHVYLAHAGLSGNLGLGKLEEHYRGEVATELEHASRLIERLLFLGGKPELVVVRPGDLVARAGEAPADPSAWLNRDVELETAAVAAYASAAQLAREQGDPASALFFERLLLTEQEHLNESEGVLEQLRLMGLQTWMGTRV